MLTNPNSNSSLLASLVQNPLLLDSSAENFFLNAVNEMASSERFSEAMEASVDAFQQTDEEFWADDDGWGRPYNVQNGTLLIPVQGILLNRFAYQFGRWATGYQYLERAFKRGQEDPEVARIAFSIHSGGGEVAGNFELVDKIFEARGNKPVTAYASDYAYSAAYSIASAADEIVLSRSGGVGSVGVVTAHVDYSEAMKDFGVKVTLIHAGAHKVDGNPYEKLPEDVKARFQDRIDRLYGEFTSIVARNRGIEDQAVRDTEALTYDASNAIEVDLADRVGVMEEELAAHGTQATLENTLMTTKPKAPATAEAATFTQEDLDQARAEGVKEGTLAGAQAEQTRYTAIMGCDAAKTRPAAAQMLVELGTDAETASTKLAAMPEETQAAAPETPAEPAPAPAAATPFAATMDGSDQPTVGADAGAEANDDTGPQAQSNALLAAYAKATGQTRTAA